MIIKIDVPLPMSNSTTNWNRSKWLSVKTRRGKDYTRDVIYSESFVDNVLSSLTIEKYDYNISLEDLVDLYVKQRGKCNLSGTIMLFNLDIDDDDESVFQMSLNRLNN
ncbi:hypothetical protein ACTFIY_000415 [Dictyostelium cf. discoideum]